MTISDKYDHLIKLLKEKAAESEAMALYLTSTSTSSRPLPLPPYQPHFKDTALVDYFLGKHKDYWLDLESRAIRAEEELAMTIKAFDEAIKSLQGEKNELE